MRQTAWYEHLSHSAHEGEQPVARIKLFHWNIDHPSLQRAQQQATWILQTQATIIILTGATYSQGCLFLCNWLECDGFTVFFSPPDQDDDGVIVATKGFFSQKSEQVLLCLSHRLMTVMCETPLGTLRIAGISVPSTGAEEQSKREKKPIQEGVLERFTGGFDPEHEQYLLVAGDFHALEGAQPSYAIVETRENEANVSWLPQDLVDAYRLKHPYDREYSWFDSKGSGYRFDYLFLSAILSPYVTDCMYVHEPRRLGLSDHSGIVLLLAVSSMTS